MKTIEIDEDIYEHLLKNTQTLGEDASAILRRLLGLDESQSGAQGAKPDSPIDACLNAPEFRSSRKAIDRFLFALSWLHRKHSEKFHMVFAVRGRGRIYFARTKADIDKSGESAFPRQIPDSPYWVITNNDTPKKQRMLHDVTRLLGYSKGEAERLSKALRA